ncbi:bifunctional Ribosomal protein L10-like domain superfamily/50S ribosomal protein L10 [Babesia duncani]|uniref:60S acidic ribosomal protein P0 n=2 Tax=Babesia TaxID=5864 RepID=A0AAD9UPN9_9APIC|nr:60s acidic ribosomal protein-like [Babesia sp. WA1]KAK2197273.1 bifunctional Ribosomal protein L10-like domain superfamily/50S ribosomal protein L10 [Babesia duncani]
MGGLTKQEKKRIYFDKLTNLVKSYPQVLVVSVDHVGSRQMAQVRHSLRGKAEILMGKNTLIRMVLNTSFADSQAVRELVQCVRLNTGFVFCIADPMEVRKVILENRVPAPARQGVIAPCDVFISAGATGMDPSQTSFFQALGISTKIVKGQIEIQNDVHLIKKGEKVTASSATLLQKLNKKPFAYGLKVEKFYDNGAVCNAEVLETTEEDVIDKMKLGITMVNALALQLGFTTSLSVNHSIVAGFKHCAAIGLDCDYEFEQIKMLKQMIDNPNAFAVQAQATQASPEASSKQSQVQEEEEEEDEDMGFSLFD